MGRLFVKHPSMPLNRSLANVFFRSGDIESWGRGYRRIVRGNESAGLLPPIVETEDGLRVTLNGVTCKVPCLSSGLHPLWI